MWCKTAAILRKNLQFIVLHLDPNVVVLKDSKSKHAFATFKVLKMYMSKFLMLRNLTIIIWQNKIKKKTNAS